MQLIYTSPAGGFIEVPLKIHNGLSLIGTSCGPLYVSGRGATGFYCPTPTSFVPKRTSGDPGHAATPRELPNHGLSVTSENSPPPPPHL
ncbi:hypothetical protein FKM82_016331 [Ascaphus truei]